MWLINRTMGTTQIAAINDVNVHLFNTHLRNSRDLQPLAMDMTP